MPRAIFAINARHSRQWSRPPLKALRTSAGAINLCLRQPPDHDEEDRRDLHLLFNARTPPDQTQRRGSQVIISRFLSVTLHRLSEASATHYHSGHSGLSMSMKYPRLMRRPLSATSRSRIKSHTTSIPSHIMTAVSVEHVTEQERIPRPPNAWILYRAFVSKKLLKEDTDPVARQQSEVSKTISAMWKAEAPKNKAYWTNLAARRKAEHAAAYPGYRYKPAKRISVASKQPGKLARTMSAPDAPAFNLSNLSLPPSPTQTSAFETARSDASTSSKQWWTPTRTVTPVDLPVDLIDPTEVLLDLANFFSSTTPSSVQHAEPEHSSSLQSDLSLSMMPDFDPLSMPDFLSNSAPLHARRGVTQMSPIRAAASSIVSPAYGDSPAESYELASRALTSAPASYHTFSQIDQSWWDLTAELKNTPASATWPVSASWFQG
ncbi:uncharacterized protein L969DRAFT_92738 [Mixia osmundae IAM 14324]|uniref:HMG box domain-containing protein n=1 Tax=Mixia osmundae (strain CBS 9802 / IAM 14324 / JCM 22182 / KY 12970) TaxID=764103 RepID=G7DYE8_MIXOS|nr:uncharacterized protein L969DRAFT_92738 [Mixia osmundae IAM 14324]KEI41510.1 hypothetical protein L969DRAFT_92738 [Mixia osmundae IAM 14324]GAA95608.1 hypothetical protein E5Q_02264 [Mixia osmundae IAM 14324]